MKLNLALFLAFLSFSALPWGSPPPKKTAQPAKKPDIVIPVPEPEAEIAQPVTVPGGTETKVVETVKTPEEVIKVEVVPGQVKVQTDYAVKSSLQYMVDVAEVANCVIYNPKFIAEVQTHKQFDYTKDNSATIAKKMAEFTPVILSTFKKPLSKTIAVRNVGSNVLYFNTSKNPRLMKYMVNTAVHERLHVVGYGHGDNSASGKGNSVPYGIGDIAEKYADACNKTKTK